MNIQYSEAVTRRCSVKEKFPCEFFEIFKNTFLKEEDPWWLLINILTKSFN